MVVFFSLYLYVLIMSRGRLTDVTLGRYLFALSPGNYLLPTSPSLLLTSKLVY